MTEGKVKNTFTTEDVAAWGGDVAAILADILNGNYPIDGAANDLRSLLAQKSEQRPMDFKDCGPFTRAWRDGKEVDASVDVAA